MRKFWIMANHLEEKPPERQIKLHHWGFASKLLFNAGCAYRCRTRWPPQHTHV
jgi:hypothetical protein